MARPDASVLAYWNREDVESMYDKHLLAAEIEMIRRRIPPGSRVLDAGCGEGEATLAYATIPGVSIDAADFSDTRLRKAADCLVGRPNVRLRQVDFLGDYRLDSDYDVVVSQRFLINLPEWELQQEVLLDLMGLVKPGGRLLVLEGSQQGVACLNSIRSLLGLPPIPIRWHNLFLDDQRLVDCMARSGFPLLEQDGISAYFLLTRGVRPMLDHHLDWDCPFNAIASQRNLEEMLGLGPRFSRLKLWVFGRPTGTLDEKGRRAEEEHRG